MTIQLLNIRLELGHLSMNIHQKMVNIHQKNYP